MENPEVTILKGQVAALQNVMYQLGSMLQSNFPNGGFGACMDNLYGSTQLGYLMINGLGPKAYERWLVDQSFSPQPYEHYPGKFVNWDRSAVNRMVKAIRDHMGDNGPFVIGKLKKLQSDYLRLYGDRVSDGFYHEKSGSSDYVCRNDQGVLLTSGKTGDWNSNLTQVYFQFGPNQGPKVYVYVPIEDKWVMGDWDHVDVPALEQVVKNFLDDSEEGRDSYRPPAVDMSAIVELFTDMDLDKYFGEGKKISMVPVGDALTTGAAWGHYLLDPLSYVSDHSLPHRRYIQYRRGCWIVNVRLDDEPDVKVIRIANWRGDHHNRSDWSELNSTEQWNFYRRILEDLDDKMCQIERPTPPAMVPELLGIHDESTAA